MKNDDLIRLKEQYENEEKCERAYFIAYILKIRYDLEDVARMRLQMMIKT